MTNSENVVRQFFQALNSHDYEKTRQYLHPQYNFTDNDGKRWTGPQGGIDFETMLFNAFPDWKSTINNTYSTGDVTVVEFTAEGTQRGQFMNINPTNRRVSVPVCGVLEVRDNKIYSEHEYWDSNTVLQQMGVQLQQTAHA